MITIMILAIMMIATILLLTLMTVIKIIILVMMKTMVVTFMIISMIFRSFHQNLSNLLSFWLLACENGTFGEECNGACECPVEKHCDPVTGDCLCPPGRSGSRCEHGKPDSKKCSKLSTQLNKCMISWNV